MRQEEFGTGWGVWKLGEPKKIEVKEKENAVVGFADHEDVLREHESTGQNYPKGLT